MEQRKTFSAPRDDSILEDGSDCSLQKLALKMKEASKVAIQHDDTRYSNIKKLVSSALEVQTANLAKSKAEDAKVLKMVEQVLALVAPSGNIKPIATSKSKTVVKENKPSEVDSIEEEIMADSESQSLILENIYDDESFESIGENRDLADQSISILREDSVDGKYFFKAALEQFYSTLQTK